MHFKLRFFTLYGEDGNVFDSVSLIDVISIDNNFGACVAPVMTVLGRTRPSSPTMRSQGMNVF